VEVLLGGIVLFGLVAMLGEVYEQWLKRNGR
jgi:hypothetical protein